MSLSKFRSLGFYNFVKKKKFFFHLSLTENSTEDYVVSNED